MIKDPIVEEIHEIRARLLKESGGNLEELMNRIKQQEQRHPDRLFSLDDMKRKYPEKFAQQTSKTKPV